MNPEKVPQIGGVLVNNITQQALEPGTNINFHQGGEEYSITVTAGHDTAVQDGSGFINYKVYIERLSGPRARQLIVARSYHQSGMASILFCGDIDQDGQPDLLINLGEENSIMYMLFLSSVAAREDIVVPAGVHIAYGC